MVFFPSYSFMNEVWEIYQNNFSLDEIECVMQDSHMTEEEREIFLNRFMIGGETLTETEVNELIHMEVETVPDKTLVGFCVLGGIFSEGIDLKKDSLIGTMIVGTGLPLVCRERELLKKFFDRQGHNGFDYAYKYPGMNKVLQASGRVIRTEEDVGVVILLDERFAQNGYLRLFPREWDRINRVNTDSIGTEIRNFWDKHYL